MERKQLIVKAEESVITLNYEKSAQAVVAKDSRNMDGEKAKPLKQPNVSFERKSCQRLLHRYRRSGSAETSLAF